MLLRARACVQEAEAAWSPVGAAVSLAPTLRPAPGGREAAVCTGCPQPRASVSSVFPPPAHLSSLPLTNSFSFISFSSSFPPASTPMFVPGCEKGVFGCVCVSIHAHVNTLRAGRGSLWFWSESLSSLTVHFPICALAPIFHSPFLHSQGCGLGKVWGHYRKLQGRVFSGSISWAFPAFSLVMWKPLFFVHPCQALSPTCPPPPAWSGTGPEPNAVL